MREEIFLLAPPCVKSGKLAVRGWTLLQSTWPCSIYEDILQSSTKSSVVHPSTVGKIGSHWPWSESRRSAVPYDKAVALAACRQPGGCRRIPYIGSERKTPWGKPVSAINTVRKSQAASRWGPWKFRPSTAYGAFQPHTRAQTRVPGQWVGYSSAVPGCHNSVGQMSPGRTQLLLLL